MARGTIKDGDTSRACDWRRTFLMPYPLLVKSLLFVQGPYNPFCISV
jgi:hypothetical protein